MTIAIDTNRYSDLMAGMNEALEVVEAANQVLIPFTVLAELCSGFVAGTRESNNNRILNAFLVKPSVSTIFANDQTTSVYASLFYDLRRRGRPIPHNDIWIAALCIQHGIALYTRDRYFDNFPQLLRA